MRPVAGPWHGCVGGWLERCAWGPEGEPADGGRSVVEIIGMDSEENPDDRRAEWVCHVDGLHVVSESFDEAIEASEAHLEWLGWVVLEPAWEAA